MSPVAVATVLLAALAWHATASGDPVPSLPDSCERRLLEMSACEVAISAPRIICTPSPSAACCRAFSSVISYERSSGSAECLCKLVGNEGLLSFPVNASRLLCLFPLCSASEEAALTAAASFLRAYRGSDAEEKQTHLPGGSDEKEEEEKLQQLLIRCRVWKRVLQICLVLLIWRIIMWSAVHHDWRRLMLHMD